MKKRYIPLIINSIFSLILLFLLINFSVAWFVDAKKKDLSLNGKSLGGYFAGGDGTKDNPYVIKTRFHMYNLAWLQYKGRFNGTSAADANALNKQFYFSVDNDIDMLGMIIPPIGTETYPFVGVFSGNGHTISNFSTTNDYAKLQTKPEDITSINIPFVGMFGIIGNYNSLFNNVGASVDASKGITFAATASNFYLHNYEVIVGTASSLSGVLAGYINASVSNIGLYYVHLNYLGKTDPLGASLSPNGSAYSLLSKYTLFGDYNTDTVDWGDNPGEQGYGKSFNINEFAARMTTAFGSAELSSNQYLPFLGTGTLVKNGSSVVGEEAADNNLGYFIGSDVKAYAKNYKFYPKFLKQTSASGQVTSVNISEEDDVYKQTFGSIDNGNTTVDILRLQSKIDTHNQLVTINNGKVGKKTYAKIVVPRRCIWVKPTIPGKLRFVLVNPGNGQNYTISKIKRSDSSDLSSGMSDATPLYESNNYGGGLPSSDAITSIDGQAVTINPKQYDTLVFYNEIEVTDKDIADGYEYVLSRDNGNNGAYFWYMDLGQNGGSSSETEMGSIESVDFVYSTSFDFTNKSNVAFEISNTAGVIFYFKRNESTVLYYISNSSNGTATKKGSGSATSATDENCDN